MSKDHTQGDFSRKSGYKSDLEIAETGKNVKSVNTSFGSYNHNAYVHLTNKTHEHFYYDPAKCKSGWHGAQYETRNNHPNKNNTDNGEKKWKDQMNFLKVLR